MIVSNCDNGLEVQAAKRALDTTCFGVIVMQSSEDWLIIREALNYALRFDRKRFRNEIKEIREKLL